MVWADWSSVADFADGGAETGGLLRTGIPPYRLPPEVLDREIDRILALLLELELAGQVRREPGPAWCRRA